MSNPAEVTGHPLGSPSNLATRFPWGVFIIPFVVYALGNSLEPPATKPGDGTTAETVAEATSPAAPASAEGANSEAAPAVEAEAQPAKNRSYALDLGLTYPWVYTGKIALTVFAMLLFWQGYRGLGGSISLLAPVIGVIGVVVWIVLTPLGATIAERLGFASSLGLGARSAYNPWEQLAGQPLAIAAFVAVRFTGLVIIVPIIEEFFWRGFIMRYFLRPDWWNAPLGQWHTTGVALATALAIAVHPAEYLAELVWFSFVTWLFVRTRNIWDAVVAHAVTNLLLGAYVVTTGHWELMQHERL